MINNIHSFKRNLEYSNRKEKRDFFDLQYKSMFPLLKEVEVVSDQERQKYGIDVVLHFKDGMKFTFQEKTRTKNYNDILLELYHIDHFYGNKTFGWLYGRQSDFIAYDSNQEAFYIFPFAPLKMAWEIHKDQWLKIYGPLIKAPNQNYDTYSIPIPVDIIFESIKNYLFFTSLCGSIPISHSELRDLDGIVSSSKAETIKTDNIGVKV